METADGGVLAALAALLSAGIKPGGVLWAEAGMMITAGGVGTGARGGGRRVLDSRVS